MNKLAAALCLFLACSAFQPARGGGQGEAAAGPNGLWQKALDLFQKNSDRYPEKIALVSEVLDRHDQPYSVTQLFFSLRMEAGGQLRTELTRALKNGKDVSEEMKKKVEIRSPDEAQGPEKKDSVTVSLSDSPFNPQRQQAVSFQARSEKQSLYGRLCCRFDFTYRTEIVRKGEAESLTWKGLAWLEEGSGMPVKLEFSLAPLPARIRSLWTIYTYEASPPDMWVLKKITIAGTGGFLFIKKRFRSTTIFNDYRRQSQPGNKS